MSKPNALSLDESLLVAVSGGGETLGNAVSRYGERRTQQLFDAVFPENYSGLDFMSDYGFVATMGVLVPASVGLAAVGQVEGRIEGAIRYATGTTDYYVDPNAQAANDAPAPDFQWSEQQP